MSGWDAPLPAGWSLVYSRSQARHYYFCKATGATQWEPPAAPPSSSAEGGPTKRARTEEAGASSSAGDAFDDGEADGTAELGAGGVGMAGVERRHHSTD